jgi:hypothetical protein
MKHICLAAAALATTRGNANAQTAEGCPESFIVVGDITRAVVVCRRADWLKLPEASQFFTETARDCGRGISRAEADSMEKSGVDMFNDDVARWGKERACREEETLLTALEPATTKPPELPTGDDIKKVDWEAFGRGGHNRCFRPIGVTERI